MAMGKKSPRLTETNGQRRILFFTFHYTQSSNKSARSFYILKLLTFTSKGGFSGCTPFYHTSWKSVKSVIFICLIGGIKVVHCISKTMRFSRSLCVWFMTHGSPPPPPQISSKSAWSFGCCTTPSWRSSRGSMTATVRIVCAAFIMRCLPWMNWLFINCDYWVLGLNILDLVFPYVYLGSGVAHWTWLCVVCINTTPVSDRPKQVPICRRSG